ncbi:N-6 DNA methylase [Polaribacter haliotis]|uniref:site-specific DNA-methyltransferase (adenine-specific) n=1 Tax=Polaribacter haliotis TaxID=1888915 RepID=A0A7L8AFA7_9FLAO|nr:N-6 DNA methylase [Polaribacter haliotis]QOD60672.1 N-6 DNA methylase [Polaribacter haliotis]
MDKKYTEIVSTIHTGYNVYSGLLSDYDYTFFVLSTILFRKLGCVELDDSEHMFDFSKIKDKETFIFFINEYVERLNYLDMIEKVDFEGESIYDVTELTTYILKLEEKVFDRYYIQMVEVCLSKYFSSHTLTIQDSLQPQELNQLINYFLPEDKNISVYNPFAGMCSLGMNLSDNTNYLAEEINPDVAKLAELRFLISDKKNFEIKNTDSIKSLNEPFNYKYDFIVSTPPFSILETKSIASRNADMERNDMKLLNGFLFKESLNNLNRDGRIVFTIPESLLYSKIKGNYQLRKQLISNNNIEILIKLPNNLFKSSAIPTYLIVLRKNRESNKLIRLIDASNFVLKSKSKQNRLDIEKVFRVLKNENEKAFCKRITVEEVEQNDYNLLVNRYFVEDLNLTEKEASHLIKLNKLVTIVKRERVIKEKGKLIRISDLSKDKLDYTKTFEDLEERDLKNSPNLLRQNTLLLSSIHTDLKPTAFIKTDSKIYYPPNFIMACLVDYSKVDLDYLVLELHKDYVINQIKAKRIGTAIQRITRKDLLEIEIVLPNMAEQLKKVDLYRSSIITKKQEDFKKLVKSYGIDVADENSFLRHQIAGTLKNARGSFKAIKQIIYEQIVPKLPGTLDIKRNELLETTLFDYINVLERDILNITNAVNVVGKEYELKSVNLQSLEIIEFLKNYVDEVKNRENNIFEISLNVDDELLSEERVDNVYINGDEKFLRRVFNNIIDNAEKHGFNNKNESTNKIEIDFLYDFDNLELQIEFGNSGYPLPENYSHEEFIRKGSKKGDNSGEGIGGWYINEIMRLHNGRFGFTDETGPEGVGGDMVTTIELIFPFEIKV